MLTFSACKYLGSYLDHLQVFSHTQENTRAHTRTHGQAQTHRDTHIR